MLKDDVTVQQVVYLQFQAEMPVEVVSGTEVQCVQSLLLDVSQIGYAHRMDAAALQIVE